MNQSTAVPTLGSYWQGQGGIRAAAEIPASDGRFYDLIVVTDSDHKPVVLEAVSYGCYSVEVEGADHFTDGKANAAALLKTQDSPLAEQAAAITSCDGQNDCYPAAIGELNIVRATCPDLLPKKLLLSSTQGSADYAWSQYFDSGSTAWFYKSNKLRAVVVRRVYR